MESKESRFAHLLQPIRELTRNWEVDVASELNDYLEELDDMCITFDGGDVPLNFAEAALLIQGSTCIYSKKVELLHVLVYQTLEFISDQKRHKGPAASGEDDDGGAAARGEADDVSMFSPWDGEVSEDACEDANTTVSVTPLPPASLMLPESREKNKLPVVSVQAEVVYSQKDFRINVFLPGDADMIVLQTEPASSRPAGTADAGVAETGSAADDSLLMDEFSMVEQQGAEQQGAEQQGAEQQGAEQQGAEQQGAEQQRAEQQGAEHVDRQKAQDDHRMLRERRGLEDEQLGAEEATPNVTPWAFHDPYATLGGGTPFRAGKCYRVPDGLEDGGKRKRKHTTSPQDFRTWFTGTFDPPEQKFRNGPTFTDLNSVYLNTMKQRLQLRRRSYRKAGVVVSGQDLRDTFLQLEEVGLEQQGEEPMEAFRQHDLMEPQKDQPSYEDLVMLRVEQLLASSRGYTQQTSLSQRVRAWEEKIQPELLLQEQRPAFDIHEYGDRIVTALQAVDRRRLFSSVVAGLDSVEACKYLLASLQLANDYTVAVDDAPGLEVRLDSMGLSLLSTRRAADRFRALGGPTGTGPPLGL
ncbi:condensin-2 complex subunit H2 isoform X2 [Antennarius striatus]|uniref:condensin-2 complex subunit H2 isoform X2 n=1 Tax=Antennarius striatus TaxID=241820 RepID=UPI0035AF90C1